MKRIAMVILLILPLVVFAQPRDDRPEPGKENWNEQLEMVLIARLTKVLNLKSEQAKQFFPLMNEFQEKNKGMRREHQDAMRRLRNLGEASSNATPIEVERAIKDLEDMHKRQMNASTVFMASASKVLEPWQVARLQVFLIRFPERVEQLIRERQGGGRRGDGMGGGKKMMQGMMEPPDDDR